MSVWVPWGEPCLGRLPHSDCLSVCVWLCVVFVRVSVPLPCSVSAVCLCCRAWESTGLCWILLLYPRSTQSQDPTLLLYSFSGSYICLQGLVFLMPDFNPTLTFLYCCQRFMAGWMPLSFKGWMLLDTSFGSDFSTRGTIKLSKILS